MISNPNLNQEKCIGSECVGLACFSPQIVTNLMIKPQESTSAHL